MSARLSLHFQHLTLYSVPLPGVVEVYRVTKRVELGIKATAVCSEKLQQLLKDIDKVWNNLIGFMSLATLTVSALESSVVALLSRNLSCKTVCARSGGGTRWRMKVPTVSCSVRGGGKRYVSHWLLDSSQENSHS